MLFSHFCCLLLNHYFVSAIHISWFTSIFYVAAEKGYFVFCALDILFLFPTCLLRKSAFYAHNSIHCYLPDTKSLFENFEVIVCKTSWKKHQKNMILQFANMWSNGHKCMQWYQKKCSTIEPYDIGSITIFLNLIFIPWFQRQNMQLLLFYANAMSTHFIAYLIIHLYFLGCLLFL